MNPPPPVRPRTSTPPKPDRSQRLRPLTRLLLVLLQLAIGWHFFYEGVWKFQHPTWSSQAYLKNAPGPASLPLRFMAGDPDVQPPDGNPAATDIGQRFDVAGWRLKEADPTPELLERLLPVDPETGHPVEPAQVKKEALHKYMPPKVAKEWDAYFDAFAKQYKLNAEGLAQREDAVLMANVALLGATPDEGLGFVADATMRSLALAEHDKKPNLSIQYAQAESLFEQLKDAYVEWLIEGKKKVKRPNFSGPAAEAEVPIQDRVKEYLAKLEEVATLRGQEDGTFHVDGQPKAKKARDEAVAIRNELQSEADGRTGMMKKALRDVLSYEQKRMGDVKEPEAEPAKAWANLTVLDTTVKWGLLVIGALLLLGLFSRTACGLGALLLLVFYVSLPALPGLPEPPNAEGHYLIINKNLVEMLALLTLATTRPGERYGLDVWLGAIWRRLRGKGKPPATAEKPAPASSPTPNGPTKSPNGDALPAEPLDAVPLSEPAPSYNPTQRS